MYLNLGLPIWPGWLASKPQESAEIAHTYSFTLAFLAGFWGLNLGSQVPCKHFTDWAILSSKSKILDFLAFHFIFQRSHPRFYHIAQSNLKYVKNCGERECAWLCAFKCNAWGSQKRALDPLELELQMVAGATNFKLVHNLSSINKLFSSALYTL